MTCSPVNLEFQSIGKFEAIIIVCEKEPWNLVDSNEETLADHENSSVNVSLTLGMGLLISKTAQLSGKTLYKNQIRMVRILNLYI